MDVFLLTFYDIMSYYLCFNGLSIYENILHYTFLYISIYIVKSEILHILNISLSQK